MSFIVQISPFVHLLKSCSVEGFAPLNPPPGLCPGSAGGLKRLPDPSPQVVPTFHFIPSYAHDSRTTLAFRISKITPAYPNYGVTHKCA